jgi:hypothetical protein
MKLHHGPEVVRASNDVLAPDGLDFRERVIWVMNQLVGGRSKYSWLEERTGINARRWKNVCLKVQQPTIDMVAGLAIYRPDFVEWMVTGTKRGILQVNPEELGWQEAYLARTFELLDQAGINKR